jgi:hypothetical protein
MSWIKEFIDTPYKIQSSDTKNILRSKSQSAKLIRAVKLERKGVVEIKGMKVKRVGYGSIK